MFCCVVLYLCALVLHLALTSAHVACVALAFGFQVSAGSGFAGGFARIVQAALSWGEALGLSK